MVNKNTADFIVIPLFLFRPTLAFRFIKFSHQLQALLISVMSQLILKQGLIEIKPFWSKFWSMRIFFK